MSGTPMNFEGILKGLETSARNFLETQVGAIQTLGSKVVEGVLEAHIENQSGRGAITLETALYAGLPADKRKLYREQSLASFKGKVDPVVAAAISVKQGVEQLKLDAAGAVKAAIPMVLALI